MGHKKEISLDTEHLALDGDTKTRLLDAAETLYAAAGYEQLSMRELTRLARTNLGAASYHFGGKEALVQSMLARRFDPINTARLTLLDELEGSHAGHPTCEQVLAAIIAPVSLPHFDVLDDSPASRFAMSVGLDLAPEVREFLRRRNAEVSERFTAAFVRLAPHLPESDARWRLHTLCFATPGVPLNANTITMLRGAPLPAARLRVEAVAALGHLMRAALHAAAPDGTVVPAIEGALHRARDLLQ